MDKWDQMAADIIEAASTDNPDKGLRVALNFLSEMGRALESVGADLDRIATALEK